MMREISVEASCSSTFEIDDEAVSDWDGAKILEVLEKRRDNDPAIYTKGANMREILGWLGIMLCVDGRTMGNFDGWGDFGPEAASGHPLGVSWEIESVTIDTTGPEVQ